jgi:hypothetical protein
MRSRQLDSVLPKKQAIVFYVVKLGAAAFFQFDGQRIEG